MNCCKTLSIHVAESAGGCPDISSVDWDYDSDYFVSSNGGGSSSFTPASGMNSPSWSALSASNVVLGGGSAQNAFLITHEGAECQLNLEVTQDASQDPGTFLSGSIQFYSTTYATMYYSLDLSVINNGTSNYMVTLPAVVGPDDIKVFCGVSVSGLGVGLVHNNVTATVSVIP